MAIQAGSAAGVAIYTGARLLLQVWQSSWPLDADASFQLAQGFSDCFDLVLDTLNQIGRLVQGYAKFSEAYKQDSDMRRLFKGSCKNILSFWQRAAKLSTRRRNRHLRHCTKLTMQLILGSL